MADAIKWPLFEVEIPGKGAHLMEAPSPFDALKTRFKPPKDMDEATASWVSMGLSIGAAWRGSDLGVEDTGDRGEYGRGVIEALHRRGYRIPQIAALAKSIGDALGKEAEDSEDFSEAQEGTAG